MGMVFTPGISVMAKYFARFKKTATGLAVCGTGVGCFILPPIIKTFEDFYGWRGTILMVAGINAQTIVFCCFYRSNDTDSERNSKNGLFSQCEVKMNFNKGEIVSNSYSRAMKQESYNESILHSKGTHSENGMDGKLTQSDQSDQASRSVIESSDIKEHFLISDQNPNLSNRDITDFTKASENTNQQTPTLSKDNSENNCKSAGIGKSSRNLLTQKLSLFSNIHFACIALYTVTLQFPFSIVYTHFGNYALSLGFSHEHAVQLYMAMGITAVIGRILIGVLTEVTKVNSTVVLTVSSLVNAIFTICLPLTGNLVILFLYAVSFSLLISPYHVLHLPMITKAVPAGQVASGYGTIMCFRVPGTALGAPLAGEKTYPFSSTS